MIILLKSRHEKPEEQDSPDVMTEEASEAEPDEREGIFCRRCLSEITTPDDKMYVNGAHIHTFANPEGIIFEIACFRDAPGCGYTGAPTSHFTWFSGYSWRIALCRRCLAHLGWGFFGKEDMFNGLITERLIYPG